MISPVFKRHHTNPFHDLEEVAVSVILVQKVHSLLARVDGKSAAGA